MLCLFQQENATQSYHILQQRGSAVQATLACLQSRPASCTIFGGLWNKMWDKGGLNIMLSNWNPTLTVEGKTSSFQSDTNLAASFKDEARWTQLILRTGLAFNQHLITLSGNFASNWTGDRNGVTMTNVIHLGAGFPRKHMDMVNAVPSRLNTACLFS